MNELHWGGPLRRRILVYALLGLGAVAGLAEAVSLSARNEQSARIERLNAVLAARNLPNFTLEQQAAIARIRQDMIHPAWSDLAPAEKIERVAKLAQRVFAAAPAAALPTPADFRGNLTALAFAHTTASGFVLKRQSDCSLTMLQGDYAFGSASTNALTLSAASLSTPHYELTLHDNAGLTTTPGTFSGGCSDSMAGTGSRRTVALGKTTSGLLIFAGVGYYPVAGSNALWYGTADAGGTLSATFRTDASLPGIASIAAGDLNGDGILDVVAVDELHAQVAVWLVNADGSLHAPVIYPLPGTNTEGAVVVDIDGDGKADVVAASRDAVGHEQLSILTGNGTGALNAAQSSALATPTTPGSGAHTLGTLIAVDLRHSGHPDLVGSNGTVLLNDGVGHLTAATAAFPALAASSNFGPDLTAGDFNKDGKIDLAVDTGALIRVFLGNGDGTFTPGATYSSVDNVGYLSAADLDGDGNLDLWSGLAGGGAFGGDQYGTEQANVLMGNGDGTFQSAPALPFVYTGTNVADLNQDGIRDAIGVNADFSLTPYIGTATGGFAAGTAIVTSPLTVGGFQVVLSNIDSLSIGDVSGDGAVDVVYIGADVNSGNRAFVARGDGHGGFGTPTAIPLPSLVGAGDTDSGAKISNIRLADVNADGKLDLVYAYTDLGLPSGTYVVGNAVQLGNGDGTFQAPTLIPYYSGTSQVFYNSKVALIADVNADGKADLLFLAQATTPNSAISTYPAKMQVALGHGDGTFGTPTVVAGPDLMVSLFYGTQYAPVALVDMNGDGKLDLVASGSSTSASPQVAVSLGNGDGTFQAPILKTYTGQYLNGQGLAVADFDGDGKPDVVLTNPYSIFSSGISYGNGDGSLQSTGDASSTYVNRNFVLAVGGATLVYDMNGDGRPDILAGSTQLVAQAAPSGSGGGGSTGGGTADFALTASAASGTVSPGESAMTTVTLTPSGGFNQAVTLTCAGLPATARCTFAPASLTANGSPVTSALTITTTAATALNATPASGDPLLPPGTLLATIGMALAFRRRDLIRLRKLGAVVGVLSLFALVSCGGDHGASLPAGGGAGTPGTAAGTYSVTITATAGTTVHSVSYTLTVS